MGPPSWRPSKVRSQLGVPNLGAASRWRLSLASTSCFVARIRKDCHPKWPSSYREGVINLFATERSLMCTE